MSLKKLKLNVNRAPRPIDPLEIFEGLTLRGTIENIWEPQAEALRAWHKARASADSVVQMNTGGGKTLVGLLIAQSLVNETQGRVVYVCPTNQLVEQTARQARASGFTPALYYAGTRENHESYEAGDTFCITNYAAVFNGRSVFADQGLSSLVLDDAHVAEGTIRNQFTISIPRAHALFGKTLDLFRPHFANTCFAARLQDVADNRWGAMVYTPMFITWKHADELRQLLLEHGVDDDTQLKFAWSHLSEHLNRCCVLLSHSRIEITPPLLPLHNLPYFDATVHRVYLTATLPSQAAFIRTFGVAQPTVICPKGKSGDAQRLFIFTPGKDDDAQRDEAKKIVEGTKSCVITPSGKRAEKWVPPAEVYDGEEGDAGIRAFAKSKEPLMLALPARYDGIDLPGDACRILILDGLPTGEGLLDRFIDEGVRVEAIRQVHTATRIVQAIGRIFRSNTDHGAVLICGSELQAWLRGAKNRSFLPALLQQQVGLGMELAKQVVADETSYDELLRALLDGDPNWDELYREYIDQFKIASEQTPTSWHTEFLLKERAAFQQLWSGQFGRAADLYGEVEQEAEPKDPRMAAWYSHWRGLCQLCAGDQQNALNAFLLAGNVRVELGRPSIERDKMFKGPEVNTIGFQASQIAKSYRTKRVPLLASLAKLKGTLVYGEPTKPVEEAVRALGAFMGLYASRPEKGEGTGPDVLWEGEGAIVAAGFDLKTGKKENGEYDKEEIGQSLNHAEWLREKFGKKPILHAIVGRLLKVSPLSNPPRHLCVIELDQFIDLADRIEAVYQAVDADDKSSIEHSFQRWLQHYGLLWPTCVESLASRLAIDLKKDQ